MPVLQPNLLRAIRDYRRECVEQGEELRTQRASGRAYEMTWPHKVSTLFILLFHKMKRQSVCYLFLLCLLFKVLLTSSVCVASILYVQGKEESMYNLTVQWAHLSRKIPEYENWGYSQQLTVSQTGSKPSLRVSVQANPCIPNLPYHAPRMKNYWYKKLFKKSSLIKSHYWWNLAKPLQEGNFRLNEVIEAVVSWVNEKLEYIPDTVPGKNARQALERGFGNCVDFSNVTAQLLTALHIEVRIVHGMIVRENQKSERMALHRWLEIHLPRVGWVFYDPTATLGFVRANHVVLFIEHSPLDVPPELDESQLYQICDAVKLNENRSTLQQKDCTPTASKARLLSRQFSLLSKSVILRGKVSPLIVQTPAPLAKMKVVATVKNGKRYRTTVDNKGHFTFSCLPVGEYMLELFDNSGYRRRKAIHVPSPGEYWIEIRY